jgi:hypothetical protein
VEVPGHVRHVDRFIWGVEPGCGGKAVLAVHDLFAGCRASAAGRATAAAGRAAATTGCAAATARRGHRRMRSARDARHDHADDRRRRRAADLPEGCCCERRC